MCCKVKSIEDDEQTYEHAEDGREGRQLAVVHQDGLRQNLAKDDIQHRAAGKAEAQRKAKRADVADHVAQQRAKNGGHAGKRRDQDRFGFAHAAADERNGDRHALGDVVQTDEDRQNERGAAHDAAVADVGRADGHALRHVVQRDSASHHDAGDEKLHLVVLIGDVLLKMVAVDQLVEVIRGLRMIGVDVRNLRVGSAVDPVVERVDDRHADGNGGDDSQHADMGLNGFGDQIKADDAEHHAAGKAQKQANGAVGVLLKHGADQAAQAGADNAGNKCG